MLSEYRKNQLKLKRCLDCTRPAVEGHIRCQIHLDYQAEQKRRKRNGANTGGTR